LQIKEVFMKTFVQLFLVGCVLTLMVLAAPSPAAADDYWTNHWNWYDNTYRPYYYRSYSNAPTYGYYGPGTSNYGYAPGYYNNYGYNNYGYGNTPYRSYYGVPGLGVGRTYGGGSAVNVGPMNFGWR